MPIRKQFDLQASAKIKHSKNARLKKWQVISAQRQFANEYTVAVRLGEPAFTEEQAEMVSALFGK